MSASDDPTKLAALVASVSSPYWKEAHRFAAALSGGSCDIEDLVSAGRMAAVKAAKKLAPSR